MAKQKNDNLVVLKFFVFSVAAVLYFCGIWFINRFVYKDYLYFNPKGSLVIAFINCIIITFSSFIINKKVINWLRNNKTKAVLITISIVCALLIPLLFLKSGTIADQQSIKKINCFGKITNEYKYSDVTKVDLSVKLGLQYDITFNQNETLSLQSHEIIFLNSFKNGESMVKFDKLISQNAVKEIFPSIEMTPSNIRRFLDDEQTFKYFNSIFNKYY